MILSEEALEELIVGELRATLDGSRCPDLAFEDRLRMVANAILTIMRDAGFGPDKA